MCYTLVLCCRLFTIDLLLYNKVQISLNLPLVQSCISPWSRYKNCSLAWCSWWEQGNRRLLVSHDTVLVCLFLALSSKQLEMHLRIHPRLSTSTGIPLRHSSLWTQQLSSLVYVAAVMVKCGSKLTDDYRRSFPCKLSWLSEVGRATSTKISLYFCDLIFFQD